MNAGFLRASRAGNLDKVLEYLNENIDINISNSVIFETYKYTKNNCTYLLFALIKERIERSSFGE